MRLIFTLSSLTVVCVISEPYFSIAALMIESSDVNTVYTTSAMMATTATPPMTPNVSLRDLLRPLKKRLALIRVSQRFTYYNKAP